MVRASVAEAGGASEHNSSESGFRIVEPGVQHTLSLIHISEPTRPY